MTPGRHLTNAILLAQPGDVRLFRNNTAMAWVGDVHLHKGGTVVLYNARPLHAGLVKGSSDLIGWRSRVIRPEHVGQTVALFTAIEVKAGRDRLTPEQTIFIENVQRAGGVAGAARSVEDALLILGRG